MTELSAIADFLQMMQDRGVPVFWRPYHETNGAFFWLCGASVPKKIVIEKEWSWSEFGYVEVEKEVDVSVEYFVNLWKMTYDYLMNERGLTNLIWMYSPNIAIDGSALLHTTL